MSQGPSCKAARMEAAESTCRTAGARPATRRARIINAASSGESSTIRTRSGGFAGACDIVGEGSRGGSADVRGDFVLQQPIEPEISDRLGELAELDGPANIAVHPEAVAAHQ